MHRALADRMLDLLDAAKVWADAHTATWAAAAAAVGARGEGGGGTRTEGERKGEKQEKTTVVVGPPLNFLQACIFLPAPPPG